MKFVWPALLGLCRTAYLAYSVWCLLFPIALLAWAITLCSGYGSQYPWLRLGSQGALALFAALSLYAVGVVYLRRDRAAPRPHRYPIDQKPDQTPDQTPAEAQPNPWQIGFLAWFGTLKWFNNRGDAPAVTLEWPSAHLLENPRGYRIGGTQTRAILAALQPGDILLRGFEGYLDGEFIRRSSLSAHRGFQPGWFTHVALYVGDIASTEGAVVNPQFVDSEDFFSVGPQRVIHSMAKGVHTEDVMTFLRCDFLAVLRLPDTLTCAPGGNHPPLARRKPHDPPPRSDALCAALASTLQNGQPVTRAQVVQAARLAALEKIGEAYDFDCSDTTEFHRFSCAELLYYCLRGVLGALPLEPRPHALYPLAPRVTWLRMLERKTITPDDYYELVHSGHLTCIWEDPASQADHAPKKVST